MPQGKGQSKKKQDSRAGSPALSSRARTREGGAGNGRQSGGTGAPKSAAGKKRRASRTVEINKVSAAPRIMRRPRPRRRPQEVTAQFGSVSPRRVKKQSGMQALGRRTRARVETVKVRGAHLPWPMIFTALACTAVIMTMVLNYVRLNELTNRYRSLQDESVQLVSDRKRLTLQLEQKNDLLDFEEQAQKSGMVKSDRVEKRYLRIEAEDKIVVPEEEGNAVTRFFSDLWSSLTGAFGNIFGGE